MRLDNFLVEKSYFLSRTKAQQAIKRKEIFINGRLAEKSSIDIDDKSETNIEWRRLKNFVSLGGFKLDKALTDFCFSVENFAVADVGSSTGGFTDCLLQNGAKKVFAVDLNSELLHTTLKRNNKFF